MEDSGNRRQPYGRHEHVPIGSERPEDAYPGEKARGGKIVLNTPLRRAVFVGGLIGIVILTFVLAVAI